MARTENRKARNRSEGISCTNPADVFEPSLTALLVEFIEPEEILVERHVADRRRLL